MQELINAISKGNKRAFSQLVGVAPTVIENIVGTRQGKPGYELLEKITFAIENINMDWLLTGRGYMLRDSKTSEESKLGGTPIATPISPAEESIIYKMYKDEKEEKERLLKEKESKIDHLQSELRALTAELAAMKAQHSQSQNKESDHHTKISEVIENFTSDSSGDYGEGYPLTKKPTSSKKLSAGKM